MFKFLDRTGQTHYLDNNFQYNLPGRPRDRAETWHRNPGAADGRACGPGRLHLMRNLDDVHAPQNGPYVIWWGKGLGKLVGFCAEKAGYHGIELRMITPEVMARGLRLGWAGNKLSLKHQYFHHQRLADADLSGAWQDSQFNTCYMNGVKLNSSMLRNVTLSCMPNLQGLSLSQTDIEHSTIQQVTFQQLEAEDLGLALTLLHGVTFSQSNLIGIQITQGRQRYTNFIGSNMNHAFLELTDQHDIKFQKCSLVDARIKLSPSPLQTQFISCDLRGALIEADRPESELAALFVYCLLDEHTHIGLGPRVELDHSCTTIHAATLDEKAVANWRRDRWGRVGPPSPDRLHSHYIRDR